MTLEARFLAELATLRLEPGPVVVGVSGGADSLALLLLLCRTADRHPFTPIVAHADHGIHPGSAGIATQVESHAAALGVPVRIGRLELGAGTGEDPAREARHRWLRSVRLAEGARWIMLAHHRDDQAETVLMRVLAGSGPAGLAGMAPVRGTLVRPLLWAGRQELAALVREAGWQPWDDPANGDSRNNRSWLRTTLMPTLLDRDPRAVDRLLGLARQAADARTAWDAVIDRLPELAPEASRGVVSVAATPLQDYDSRLACAVIQAAGRRAGAIVGPAAAGRVERLVEGGRSGAWVNVGGGWRAELAFGRLRFVPPGAPERAPSVSLGESGGGAFRWGRWEVRWGAGEVPVRVTREGWSSWFIPGACELRSWAPGDRIRPRGAPGSRLVVRCMQDARVPRTDRQGWPVVVGRESGVVLWVPGICRAEDAVPTPGSEAMRIDVQPG